MARGSAAKTLLVVGGASLDVLHLRNGTARSAGGAGLYTALAAARSGAAVTMYGPRPEPMPEELRAVDGRIEWVGPAVAPAELPRFEIVNEPAGRTRMLHYTWGAEARLRPDEAPRVGRPGDWVYCVPLADPSLRLAFLGHFKRLGYRVACGTYGHLAAEHLASTRQAADEADAFFCNEGEARTLFGGEGEVRARPGRLLFVTRGARGSRVVQGGHATDLAGAAAREVDPTGAGDTFCGTVLARLAAGDHPVEAARWGMAQAAEMVADVGPRALLVPTPAPEPLEDGRVVVDAERLERVASLLRHLADVHPPDFAADPLPRLDSEWALDFFFAATLQQFGFWEIRDDRYGGPLEARLQGRSLKGSDYLWAAYARWAASDPTGLGPAAQAVLAAEAFARQLRDDDGMLPLPAVGLHHEAARAYGADMAALDWTPEAILTRANAAESPVASLLEQLDHVGGYKEDPLRKKSALLTLILRQRPERFLRDPGDDDVPPIVDYHAQRSCLRLGLVSVEDTALGARLRAREVLPARDEEAVRRAAFRAVSTLRERSGRPMAVCDAFLFEMRRRCPEMSEPECARCPADPACAHRKELFQPVLRTSAY